MSSSLDPFRMIRTVRLEHSAERQLPQVLGGCRLFGHNPVLINPKDGVIKKCGKLVFGAVYFPCLAAVNLVAAIISHLALVILKLLQFFIPKNFSQTINEEILGPTFQVCRDASESTAFALSSIFANFISYERSSAWFKYTDRAVYDIYRSKTFSNILRFHIDGFEKPNFSPSSL